MQPIPGGAAARPFVTHHNALDVDLYLRIAPELYLKRLVVGGYDRVYELNRTFRNEGMSTQHNPEFTMLEFYQAYADVGDLMELTETLLLHVAQTLLGRTRMTYQEHELDLTPPWRRLPFFAALTQALGAEVGPETPARRLRELGAARGVELAAAAERWEAWPELFESLVEPTLVQPTFVVDFPVELSPLSKRKRDDPRLVDRFELFVAQGEIANAYTELNDPIEQRERFLQQAARREGGDDEAHWFDEDFIRALEYGMPPTAGEGIGIDRLVMLLTNQPSIREVILFPHLRPEAGSPPRTPSPTREGGASARGPVTNGLPFELFLGLRYLRARGQRTNLSLFVWIGIGGVFLGVAALIVVLAVMTGFQDGIRDKIIAANPHILIFESSGRGVGDAAALAARVRGMGG